MIRILLMAFAILVASCAPRTSSKTETAAPEADTAPAKHIALSFDDGPNETTTAEVLDVLQEHNVPASFFVIGQFINETTAKQMTRAISLGCEVQNHSLTHTMMTQLTSEQVAEEVRKTDELIEKHTGTKPWLFRPPFIDHNPAMHQTIAHTFICGVGCEDWVPERTAQERYDALINTLKDGDIVLLHDLQGNDNTVEALKMLIPEMKKQGYTFVTVTELYKLKGVTPEAHNGIIYSNVLQ